jgi:hypothetical protein
MGGRPATMGFSFSPFFLKKKKTKTKKKTKQNILKKIKNEFFFFLEIVVFTPKNRYFSS